MNDNFEIFHKDFFISSEMIKQIDESIIIDTGVLDSTNKFDL